MGRLASVDLENGITYVGMTESNCQHNTAIDLTLYTMIPTHRIAEQESPATIFLKKLYLEKKEKEILDSGKIRVPEGGIVRMLED